MAVSERVVLVGPAKWPMDAVRERLVANGFDVIGAASSSDEALRLVARGQVGIVVVDLALGAQALTCLRKMKARYPRVAVVVLYGPGDEVSIEALLAEGAAACVLRSGDPADIVTAVRQARRRSVFYPADAGRRMPDSGAIGTLTERELEILRLVAEGASNLEIARKLWVTDHTVKFHLSKIYRKLGVSNRTEASRYAERHGLVNPTTRVSGAR